jgi:hypothetical protein
MSSISFTLPVIILLDIQDPTAYSPSGKKEILIKKYQIIIRLGDVLAPELQRDGNAGMQIEVLRLAETMLELLPPSEPVFPFGR